MLGIGTFAFININLYESDKIAYIHDASLSLSRGMSKQISRDFSKYEAVEKIILYYFNSKEGKFQKSNLNFVKETDDIVSLSIYKEGDDGKTLLDSIQFKTKVKLDQKMVNFYLSKLVKEQKIVSVVDIREGVIGIFKKIIIGEEVFLTSLLFQSDTIGNMMNEKSSFASFLVNDLEKIVPLSKSSTKGEVLSKLAVTKTIFKNNLRYGSNELGGYLLSYSKIAPGLAVTILVERSLALSGVKKIIEKMILILVIFISLALIVSILSARKLTSSVLKLNSAANQISEGDFDIEIDINSRDEIGNLGKSFSFMAKKVSTLLKELNEYSRNLEKMVEERTIELQAALSMQKAMVNSLDQAFFVVDSDEKLLDVYSHATKGMFEYPEPKGASLLDLLQMNEDERASFNKFWDHLFKEAMPFKDMSGLLPQKIENKQDRKIFLSYYPIRDDDKKISEIVVVGTDKTEEVLALQELEKEKAFIKMFMKINSNKSMFVNFYHEARGQIEKLQGLLGESDFNYDEIFRVAHTLKGNFGLYALLDLVDLAHELESECKNYNDSKDPELLNQMKKYCTEITDLFLGMRPMLKDVFHISDEETEGTIEISVESIDQFFNEFIVNQENQELTHSYFENIYARPIESFFVRYNEFNYDMADVQCKKINPIIVASGNLKVIEKEFRELFDSFIHIFKNIIDHGLEYPEDRVAEGKTEEGNIRVLVEEGLLEGQRMLDMTISDDGRGIDIKKIKEKLSLERDISQLSENQLLQTVFESEMSTKDSVDKNSGRGVGLSAVKVAVEKMGGSITVDSEVMKGTAFSIKVPQKIYY